MDHSLYLHIPFCRSRCHYCDFNTYAGVENKIPTYMAALEKEFRIVIFQKEKYPLHTIYIGGGTPSLIPLSIYQSFFGALRESFIIASHCEISLEANPGTLSYAYLRGLKALGVTRLSIGVQSTNPFDLARLDRSHSLEDILTAVADARRAGFDNLNLDMIFGLPWQSLTSWEHSLARAIALRPEHFSLYSLIVEPGTPLAGWYDRGLLEPQDQDLEAEMFEMAITMLAEAGYDHYEISSWALKNSHRDFRCQHNLQYWHNRPYFGLGAGAHGYLDHQRLVNVAQIAAYINRVNDPQRQQTNSFPCSPATVSRDRVDPFTQMQDFMMLGLRLVKEGVSAHEFVARYDGELLSVFGAEIDRLLNQELVQWLDEQQTRLRLTPRGIFLANRVFREFVN